MDTVTSFQDSRLDSWNKGRHGLGTPQLVQPEEEIKEVEDARVQI